MAKLPPTFVKAPSAAAKPVATVATPAATPIASKRARKPSLVAEVVRDVRELLIKLDDAEHQALEDARTALVRAGEQITLEQMVHRVLGEWIHARNAPAPTPAAAAAPATAPRYDELIRERLRAFVAAPLRTWRELGTALRRWVPAR